MLSVRPHAVTRKSSSKRPALLAHPRLDEDVVPFTECRRRLAEYFEQTRKTHRPVIVTQNGRASTLLVNISDFEEMREALELIEDVRVAEEEIELGEVIPQAEARRQSREKLKQLACPLVKEPQWPSTGLSEG